MRDKDTLNQINKRLDTIESLLKLLVVNSLLDSLETNTSGINKEEPVNKKTPVNNSTTMKKKASAKKEDMSALEGYPAFGASKSSSLLGMFSFLTQGEQDDD